MRSSSVSVSLSLLFLFSLFATLCFSAFSPNRRNPIRQRPRPKVGLCPQNYVNTTRPAYKHYRLHKPTGKCFKLDTKGPCGKNMQFYRIGNTDFGDCDCQHKKRCGRPLLYWKEHDACYFSFTQGPCKEGYWLVYGYQNKPICQKNACHKFEKDNPSNHAARKFWIHYRGKCMKTRTQGYCKQPDQVLFFVDGEARPRCVYAEEASMCNSLNRISRPCWVGQRYQLHGDCEKHVGLWGSEDNH
ncbi:unnamed protein product [Orchesella dallaii]|uniref:DUF4789 domain-containing protein n=1 Tax=Orchesella dallaii TaxID=48710 RepID=A0ABP1QGU0_9HEXA